jgi:hypothetical protein
VKIVKVIFDDLKLEKCIHFMSIYDDPHETPHANLEIRGVTFTIHDYSTEVKSHTNRGFSPSLMSCRIISFTYKSIFNFMNGIFITNTSSWLIRGR